MEYTVFRKGYAPKLIIQMMKVLADESGIASSRMRATNPARNMLTRNIVQFVFSPFLIEYSVWATHAPIHTNTTFPVSYACSMSLTESCGIRLVIKGECSADSHK